MFPKKACCLIFVLKNCFSKKSCCLIAVIKNLSTKKYCCLIAVKITYLQGWKFTHRFLERIALFLQKNVWMSNSLKKNEWFAHFWWATWAICSQSLIFGGQAERFAHSLSFLVSSSLTVALLSWATWVICSYRSLKTREWANCSFFNF